MVNTLISVGIVGTLTGIGVAGINRIVNPSESSIIKDFLIGFLAGAGAQITVRTFGVS